MIKTNRRLTSFARAVLVARAGHLQSLLSHFGDVDINCGQDFHMLLNVAVNAGIRQCDIARALDAPRNKLSSWSNRISVARAPSERLRIARAIQKLLEKKLDEVNRLIADGQSMNSALKPPVPHPDMIL